APLVERVLFGFCFALGIGDVNLEMDGLALTSPFPECIDDLAQLLEGLVDGGKTFGPAGGAPCSFRCQRRREECWRLLWQAVDARFLNRDMSFPGDGLAAPKRPYDVDGLFQARGPFFLGRPAGPECALVERFAGAEDQGEPARKEFRRGCAGLRGEQRMIAQADRRGDSTKWKPRRLHGCAKP